MPPQAQDVYIEELSSFEPRKPAAMPLTEALDQVPTEDLEETVDDPTQEDTEQSFPQLTSFEPRKPATMPLTEALDQVPTEDLEETVDDPTQEESKIAEAIGFITENRWTWFVAAGAVLAELFVCRVVLSWVGSFLRKSRGHQQESPSMSESVHSGLLHESVRSDLAAGIIGSPGQLPETVATATKESGNSKEQHSVKLSDDSASNASSVNVAGTPLCEEGGSQSNSSRSGSPNRWATFRRLEGQLLDVPAPSADAHRDNASDRTGCIPIQPSLSSQLTGTQFSGIPPADVEQSGSVEGTPGSSDTVILSDCAKQIASSPGQLLEAQAKVDTEITERDLITLSENGVSNADSVNVLGNPPCQEDSSVAIEKRSGSPSRWATFNRLKTQLSDLQAPPADEENKENSSQVNDGSYLPPRLARAGFTVQVSRNEFGGTAASDVENTNLGVRSERAEVPSRLLRAGFSFQESGTENSGNREPLGFDLSQLPTPARSAARKAAARRARRDR
jgi:hypothetical protein